MNEAYEVVVGLETHAELNTKTKIFCACKNEFGGEPNTRCCPVCAGLPGALPVLNAAAVDSAIRMGLACGCAIRSVCRLDRKNYFYPDLPKAYQISQFDAPLCENGFIDVILDETGAETRVRIARIHIEEDAGKLVHGEGSAGTRIDYNRCGVPLIEIVSEPDLRSSTEAKAYLDTIKAILQALGISDCRMQEGSIRCDVNVSVRRRGEKRLGTRVEMKNVNSFSAVARAIDYEAARQIAILEAGGQIAQETRRWDDLRGENTLLRSKEDAQDYRFFPEPDLPAVTVPGERIEALRARQPELPNARLKRFRRQYGLPYVDAKLLTEERDRGELMEAACALGAPAKAAANWLNGDAARFLSERGLALSETKLTAAGLAALIGAVSHGTISNTAGKIVLEELLATGKDVATVIAEKELAQVSDAGALAAVARQVLAANAKAADDYRSGKTNAMSFLMGQCMRASRGRGNPALFREILTELLKG